MTIFCVSFCSSLGSTGVHPEAARTDTPRVEAPWKRPHWINVDLAAGRQYLSGDWDPYQKTTFIAASCQVKRDWFPLWLDGSFYVTWAGETDADGHRAGPGISLVQMQGGLGKWWYPDDQGVSFYAAGGASYVWGKFTSLDNTKPAQINPAFPDQPIYPNIDEEGHFLGGYLRCGIALFAGEELYLGIGLLAKVTMHRTLLGRNLNINSVAIGVFLGAGA
jgi:hypothetical protein